MVEIRFVQHDGSDRSVIVRSGISLMEAAVLNGVPGIDAECGGNCVCATCHVYIGESWLNRLVAPLPTEAVMLELVEGGQSPNSRLACQIMIEDALNGLTVQLPKSQR